MFFLAKCWKCGKRNWLFRDGWEAVPTVLPKTIAFVGVYCPVCVGKIRNDLLDRARAYQVPTDADIETFRSRIASLCSGSEQSGQCLDWDLDKFGPYLPMELLARVASIDDVAIQQKLPGHWRFGRRYCGFYVAVLKSKAAGMIRVSEYLKNNGLGQTS